MGENYYKSFNNCKMHVCFFVNFNVKLINVCQANTGMDNYFSFIDFRDSNCVTNFIMSINVHIQYILNNTYIVDKSQPSIVYQRRKCFLKFLVLIYK